ncbi:MAG: cbb3-type cytochrome c oxidase N-terminal domain-containing protein [Planctomycetota bacterium]
MPDTKPPTEEQGHIPDDPLTGHNYDGIQEYDNPTPGWWTWLFVGSILFAPLYLIVAAGAPVLFGYDESYEAAKTSAMMEQFATLGELTPNEITLARFADNPTAEDAAWLGAGQSIFQANCAACHGSNGAGVSAPNLTDDHYLNLDDATGIITVINKGAKNGAMPPWEGKLLPNEVVLVSAYVASLRGQNLPSPRAAEGEVIPPFFESE